MVDTSYPLSLVIILRYSPKCLEKLSDKSLGHPRVPCAGFEGRQQEHRASVFFADGGMVELAGTDADRVLNAMEDFAGYHRS